MQNIIRFIKIRVSTKIRNLLISIYFYIIVSFSFFSFSIVIVFFYCEYSRGERRNWWNKLFLLTGGCGYMDNNRDSDIGIRFPWKLEQRKGKREELSCIIIRRRFANLFSSDFIFPAPITVCRSICIPLF